MIIIGSVYQYSSSTYPDYTTTFHGSDTCALSDAEMCAVFDTQWIAMGQDRDCSTRGRPNADYGGSTDHCWCDNVDGGWDGWWVDYWGCEYGYCQAWCTKTAAEKDTACNTFTDTEFCNFIGNPYNCENDISSVQSPSFPGANRGKTVLCAERICDAYCVLHYNHASSEVITAVPTASPSSATSSGSVAFCDLSESQKIDFYQTTFYETTGVDRNCRATADWTCNSM